MARRVYTEKDQARVAVILQGTEGNIKRTAREAGVAVSTVRGWRDKWEKEGYPEAIEEAMPEARSDYLLDLKEIVALATDRLKETLRAPGTKISAKDLAWVTGVFVDKIRIIEGMATTRHETVHALPAAAEMRDQLRGFLVEIVEAADIRQAEVIDAGLGEVVEEAEFTPLAPLGLPASQIKE
jgi:transposase-like protein